MCRSAENIFPITLAVKLLLHRGIEEVVEVVEVLHGEMLLESCSGMLEKLPITMDRGQERRRRGSGSGG
jgi:hypothetical protein